MARTIRVVAVALLLAATAAVPAATDLLPAQAQTTDGVTIAKELNTTFEPDEGFAGGFVEYLLTVTNTNVDGDPIATTVTDPLTPALTLVSATPTVGTCSGATTVDCAVTVAPNTSEQVVVRANIDPTARAEIVNTATVTSPGGTDTDSASFFPAVDVALAIVKDGPSAVVAGQPFQWTVTVTNDGLSSAQNVVITDDFPAEAIISSASGPLAGDCTVGATSLTCGPFTLGPSLSSETITINASTDPAQGATSLLNEASVTSDEVTDPLTAELTTDVAPGPVLSLSKAGPTSAVAGGADFEFTYTVANSGAAAADTWTITDPLPAGLSFVSSSDCTAVGQTVTCSGSGTPAGESDTATITVAAGSDTPPGDVTNTATLAGTGADGVPAQATVTIVGEVDITAVKTDSGGAVAGDPLTYTIELTNSGPSDAQNVVIDDTLPPNVTFVSSPSGCTGTTTVVCTVSNLLADETPQSVEFTVLLGPAVPAGTITNSAAITVPGYTNNGTSPVTLDTDVARTAVLGLVKDALPEPVFAGDQLTYSFTVTNSGPSDAADVVIADTLPAGLTFASSADGCTATATGIECQVGTVPASGQVVVTAVVDVAPGLNTGTTPVAVANSAVASSPDAAEDATASVTSTVNADADLGIVKSANPNPVTAGNPLSYTLVVTNNGPSTGTGIVITDEIPSGLVAPLSVSPADICGIDSGTGNVVCNPLPLAPGEQVVVVIDGTASSEQVDPLENSATVAATTPDSNPSNNQSSTSTTVGTESQLSLSKSAPSVAIAGDPAGLIYDLVVTNNGPSEATNVVLTDTLPPGVVLVSAIPDNGTSCDTTISCALGDIADGASVGVQIIVTVPPSLADDTELANTASVIADGTEAANASALTTVQRQAGFDISKVGSSDEVDAGGQIVYTITVDNIGPSDATGVTVIDTLPAGFTFAGSDAGCVVDGQLVTCDLDGLTVADDPVVINITADVSPDAPAGTVTNVVQVASNENNPGNNTASADTTVNRAAVLSVTKADDPDPVTAGGALVYTITVANDGPGTATNIVVVDTLPSDVTVGVLDGCTEAAGVVTCDPFDLAVGESEEIVIPVTVDSAASGTLTNNVAVSSNESDTVLASAETTVVASADLAITKTDNPNPVVAGEPLAYTITVTNNGPSDAQTIVVTDNLPDGFTLGEIDPPTGCTPGAQTVTCNFASLAAGAQLTFDILGTADSDIPAGSVLNNQAQVLAATSDPDPSNNTAGTATDVDREADLLLAKSGPFVPVVAGELVSFLLGVQNLGPSDAADVTLSDTLPPGLTFDPTESDAACTADGQLVTCNLGTGPAGTSIVTTIGATTDPSIPTGADRTNEAVVSTTDFDPDPGNNSASFTIAFVAQADLTIAKEASLEPAVAGGPLSYTVTVTNNGPSDATDVVVTDTLPDDFILDTIVPGAPVCAPAGQVVTCNLGTLAAGATTVITLNGTVDPDTTAQTITNTAIVASPDDSSPDNNTATVETTVVTEAALSVTKTADQQTATPGDDLTYTVTVTNNGPSDATNVLLSDPAPDGTTVVSATPSNAPTGTCNNDVSCSLGELDPGESVVVTIVVNVNPDRLTAITNTATATADQDPDGAAASTVTPVEASADLAITKEGPAEVNAGEVATYVLTVDNLGPSDAVGVQLVDVLPPEVQFLSAPACTEASGVVTCNLDTILAGQSAGATIDVLVPPDAEPGTITNNVSVGSLTNDPDTGNNTASLDTTVALAVTLSLDKADAPDPVNAGDDLTYTLTVTNDGPSDATDVIIVDTLPGDVAFVSAGPDCVQSGLSEVTCDIGALAAGASAARDIVVSVPPNAAGLTLLNSAEASSSETAAPATAESDTEVVGSADMSIVKESNPGTVVAGNPLSYGITVTNNGPSDAEGVTVNDVLPPGFTFGDVDVAPPAACEELAGTVACDLGTVAAGDSVVITINGTANSDLPAGSTLVNPAVVTATTPDPNENNNSTSVDTPVQREADLAVNKVGPVDAVTAGDQFSYTLSATNNGPSDANNVQLVDNLPAQVTFVSAPGCSEASGVVTCPLGNLAAGATSPDIVLTVAVPPGTADGTVLENTASVGSDEFDPNTQDNTITVETLVATSADLAITKADTGAVVAGGPITYVLTVTNNGPSDAQLVGVLDTLPLDVTVTSTTVSNGGACVVILNVATCAVGAVAPGEVVTITIEGLVDPARLPSPPPLGNLAVVASLVTPDPVLGNNSAFEFTQVTTEADLAIGKTSDTPSVVAGDPLVYTVTVVNNGPSDAQNVVITDVLPGGFTFGSVDPAANCAEAAGTVTCTVPTLAAGDDFVVTIEGTANADLPAGFLLQNPASVTSDTFDPDPSNNSTVLDVPVEQLSDLSIEKTAPETVVAGETMSYSFDVTNAGPSDANGVTITDELPPGVSFQGGGGCVAAGVSTVSCSIGTLAAGATDSSVNFTVAVSPDVLAGTVLVNTATVGSSSPESDPTNNTDTAETTVLREVTLTLEKADVPDPVVAGTQLEYTLTVGNLGPSTASGVEVVDTLPAGVTFASASGGCAEAAGVVTCDLGGLAVGAEQDVTILVNVDPDTRGIITNTATATSNETDGAVEVAVETTVVGVTDLAITKVDIPDPVVAGLDLTFTIAVTNNGPSTSSAPFVVDQFPSQVLIGALPPFCAEVGPVVECLPGELIPGQTVEFDIVVTVPNDVADGTILTNQVEVIPAEGDTDPNLSNNVATTQTTVQAQADLSILKTAPETVVAGEQMIYSLTVDNLGPSFAESVVITDTLPPGVSFVGANADCSADGQNVTCQLGNLGPDDAPVEVLITVATESSLLVGQELVNTATVTSATFDPDPENNTSTATTIVERVVGLTIEKFGSPNPVVAGTELTYDITIGNVGPSDAANVVMTDTLPDGFTATATTLPSPTCVIDNLLGFVTCVFAELPAGAEIDITVTGIAESFLEEGAVLENTATLVSDEDLEGVSTDETVDVIRQVDLAISKTDDPDPVIAGTELTYEIVVTNDGPSDASGVEVNDTLPATVTLVEAAGCTDVGQLVTCEIGDLAAGADSDPIVITVAVPSSAQDGSTLFNTAIVDSIEPELDPSNNTVTEETQVIRRVDLSITKIGDVDPVVAGTQLTYTLEVANAGPSDAAGVQITDNLPPEVDFASDGGCTQTSGVVTCELGDIAAGESVQVDIVVNVPASTPDGAVLTNTASVGSDNVDTDPENNTTELMTDVIREVFMVIEKLDDPDPVVAGTDLTYTVLVTNDGPSNASGVTIVDTLPEEVEFSGAPNCDELDGVVTCEIPNELAPGESAERTITVGVPPSVPDQTTITNTAQVLVDEFNNNVENDTVTEDTLVITEVDLAITKTSEPDPVIAGEELTYVIQVTNLGPSDAQGVVVTDTLPGEVTFVSAEPEVGICEAADGVVTCELGTVPAEGSIDVELVIVVDVSPETPDGRTITNRANVSSETTERDPRNNSVTEDTLVLALADLAITKVAVPETAIAGERLTYEITVVNNGPSDAPSTQVADILPDEVTFAASEACTDGGPTLCDLGDIPAGEEVTFTLIVLVDSAAEGPLVNEATVASSVGDPDLSNNTVIVSTDVVRVIDLGITKVASPLEYTPGQLVTYTIEAGNGGPSDALDAVITDPQPAGIASSSWTCSTGCSPAEGTGDVDTTVDIPAGERVTITVLATVAADATGDITNTATVTADGESASASATISQGANTITGRVFRDLNGNGVPDPGDPDIPGVTITFTRADASGAFTIPAGSVVTTSPYVSPPLAPGEYRVAVDLGTVPPGLVPTTLTQVDVAVTGATAVEVNFGFRDASAPPAPPRPGGGGGRLPATGSEVGGLLGVGVLLLIAGGAMVLPGGLLARRRRLATVKVDAEKPTPAED